MAIAAAACAFASFSALADQTPELEKILAAVRDRFSKVDRAIIETRVTLGQTKRCLRAVWERSGKLRQECWNGDRPEGEAHQLRIDDGKTNWLFFPAQKKYYELGAIPEDLLLEPLFAGFTPEGRLFCAAVEAGREREINIGGGAFCAPLLGGSPVELVADEEVDGRPCHVLRYSAEGKTLTFHVAKADSTPLRWSLESRSEYKGKEFVSKAVTDLVKLETSFDLDEKQFQFTPPEGSAKASAPGEDALLAAGTQAPDFRMTDRSGKTVGLSDFQGSILVLNFWFFG